MPKEMPGLAILLAKKKSADQPDDPYSEESDEDVSGGEEDSAVSAMMEALRSKDVQGFKESLQAFLEICYPSLEKEEEE